MKRSEMLKVLNDSLLEMGMRNRQEASYDNNDLDYILTRLEDAGMLPPKTFARVSILEFDGIKETSVGELVKKWEPEE